MPAIARSPTGISQRADGSRIDAVKSNASWERRVLQDFRGDSRGSARIRGDYRICLSVRLVGCRVMGGRRDPDSGVWGVSRLRLSDRGTEGYGLSRLAESRVAGRRWDSHIRPARPAPSSCCCFAAPPRLRRALACGSLGCMLPRNRRPEPGTSVGSLDCTLPRARRTEPGDSSHRKPHLSHRPPRQTKAALGVETPARAKATRWAVLREAFEASRSSTLRPPRAQSEALPNSPNDNAETRPPKKPRSARVSEAPGYGPAGASVERPACGHPDAL